MLDSGYTSVDGRVLAKPGTALGPGHLLFARSVSDNRFLFGLFGVTSKSVGLTTTVRKPPTMDRQQARPHPSSP